MIAAASSGIALAVYAAGLVCGGLAIVAIAASGACAWRWEDRHG